MTDITPETKWTPDELREAMRRLEKTGEVPDLDAAADAWETDIARGEMWHREFATATDYRQRAQDDARVAKLSARLAEAQMADATASNHEIASAHWGLCKRLAEAEKLLRHLPEALEYEAKLWDSHAESTGDGKGWASRFRQIKAEVEAAIAALAPGEPKEGKTS